MSLWYRYKAGVWSSDDPQTAAVHNIMRVLRSIRNAGRLAYVSVPITSGKYLYDLQCTSGGPVNIKDVINHNYHQGFVLTDAIVTRRNCPVLYPAELVPARQKWRDEHFQALWLSIVAEKCTEVHMSEGWEFSNGGAEEFVHTWQLRLGLPRHKDILFFNTKGSEEVERARMRAIAVYDHLGNPLSLGDGIKMIRRVNRWIDERGFYAPRLRHCVDLLKWTGKRINASFYQ